MIAKPPIVNRLFRTAMLSPCNYRISAVAFDKKGDVLGNTFNTFRNGDVFAGDQHRTGAGLHAEARLMKRYGKNIKTILIMRIGNSGNILPIDPCPACKRMAKKLGIKIVTVFGRGNKKPSKRISNLLGKVQI